MNNFLFLVSCILVFTSYSQPTPQNGIASSKPIYYALKNATIIASPTKTYQNATILIKGSTIEKIGLILTLPAGTVEIDCKGKTILPAFIELYTNVGLPAVEATRNQGRSPQLESNKPGAYYWNEHIHPEVEAGELFVSNAESNKQLIEKGFGFALTHQFDGIARGAGAFVSLGNEQTANLSDWTTTSFFSLRNGVSRQTYPSSQMGAIALLRQAIYDAYWYKENAMVRNISLEALNSQLNNRLFFLTNDKNEILRAHKIGNEFKLGFNFIGSGNEYEIVDQLTTIKSNFIIPINFPAAYEVKNPYVARQIPLSDLKHWEMAPLNPGVLAKKGVSISITSNGIKTTKDFWSNLRSAIQHGLTQEQALEALTMAPAKTIGVDSIVGSLEEGKIASFIVYDVNPFEKEAQMLSTWLMGEPTTYIELPEHDVAGKYNITLSGKRFPLELKGEADKLKGTLTYQTKPNDKGITIDSVANVYVKLNKNDITLQFIIHDANLDGSASLQGKVNSKLGVFEGEGLLPNGEWVKWSAIKNSDVDEKKDKSTPNVKDTTIRTWHPNMAYGFDTIPAAKTTVIKNATLWTNEAEGIIENGMLVIIDGKIDYAGPNKDVPGGSDVIDAQGKHVTTGIIDEHSHIAISSGVNEGGQSISAEVSIGDVVNPDDINVYRQLSGGVTAAQLLHGSANPIGGQSALIKLKWGTTAEEMLIDNAPKFIKFALGENVKQANWGDNNTVRFPQTRMGVEQVYYDGFNRAQQYAEEWQQFKNGETTTRPRTDLELEVLNEILNSQRFISCHSYVQSEINMLMHVADSMGFKVNTFTHILEGYKVADKMAEHGVGGSTFSDWWAYKFEVNDAIPYNASLMASQGVVVAINSDDAEMGRRLNQEAAKGIKYGGMTETEAWKMVTLNPAKLLHLDDRMGSLKAGKDADIVIWSHNPLSIYAQVEKTMIEGVIYYDQERDKELRERNQQERARIITKMLEDNQAGGTTRPFFKKKRGAFHCDTIGEQMSTEENHH